MHRYAAQYCEENVWWLAREPRFAGHRAEVVVVSNASRTVLVHAQRAAEDGGPVVWDYHVVLAVRREEGVDVWDLDCTLGAPLPAHRWLAASFDPATPAPFAPGFRVVPAETYVRELASDRRHMRTAEGEWVAPPPPWPVIGGGVHDLERWIDVSDRSTGEVLDLEGLTERWR